MAIEILDLPNLKMVIFHSFLYVYQRVGFIKNYGINNIRDYVNVYQRVYSW